jgi:hypothetical protein
MHDSQFDPKKKLYHDRILKLALSDLKSRLSSQEDEFRIITEPAPKLFHRDGRVVYSPDIFVEKPSYDEIYEIKSMRDFETCRNASIVQMNQCVAEYRNLGRDFRFVLVKPRRRNPKKPKDLEFITVYETSGLEY